MSVQNVAQHPPNRTPMESISTQYESSGSMSMWEALVQVATQRYEELLEDERRQKERQKQETSMMVGGQCEADQQSSDQSATLIRSAEISIAENVTVGGEDEDEEDPGRLVIDESAAEVPKAESVVDQVVPVLNGTEEQKQHIQQQRETVIQPCRSSSVNSGGGDNGPAVPDQGESPQVRLQAATLTTGVRPIRQPKHMSQVTFNRFMPYQIPMSYNKNMARKFPGAECRTPEQQAVREKNTIAARQSRAKMRMMDEMLQQEASNEKTHNHYMKERMAGLFTYANVLRDKIGLEETDFLEEFERVKQDYVPGPMRTHYVRNRSRSGQGNGENGQSSPFGLNGHVASAGESDVALNEKSNEITNGSETDSAPEPDGTVLDLSVKSKRDRSVGNGVF
ncbi:uncharacterized protein LOC135709682 isoform X1 [Ochlerotatus camptorhynchus]|uniref:uncharacterized protein LOC135709682 isoform X1 n=1 Tax=Ochlerotatus camptorhynchus TaxID=644619 RepID=UPI0031D57235